MSKIMYFPSTAKQALPDPPYLSQMTSAKLSNTAGATLVKIYDGVDATGELTWELQVSAAGEVDYNNLSADGAIFASGSVYVDFISGSGEVFLAMK